MERILFDMKYKRKDGRTEGRKGLLLLTIGLDSVLEAIELPASITGLNSSLSNMNGNNFTHC